MEKLNTKEQSSVKGGATEHDIDCKCGQCLTKVTGTVTEILEE